MYRLSLLKEEQCSKRKNGNAINVVVVVVPKNNSAFTGQSFENNDDDDTTTIDPDLAASFLHGSYRCLRSINRNKGTSDVDTSTVGKEQFGRSY